MSAPDGLYTSLLADGNNNPAERSGDSYSSINNFAMKIEVPKSTQKIATLKRTAAVPVGEGGGRARENSADYNSIM